LKSLTWGGLLWVGGTKFDWLMLEVKICSIWLYPVFYWEGFFAKEGIGSCFGALTDRSREERSKPLLELVIVVNDLGLSWECCYIPNPVAKPVNPIVGEGPKSKELFAITGWGTSSFFGYLRMEELG
jgi:hypothetical protein